MQPERIREPDPDAEDKAYDDWLQRQLDDEMEAKRRASGNSPEQLAIQDAFNEGQRAGAKGNASGLNPFQDGTPEHDAWERGRSGAERMRLVHTRT